MRLSDSNGYCQARIVRSKSKIAMRMTLRVMNWAIKPRSMAGSIIMLLEALIL